MANVEVVTFRGIRFRRYPNSAHESDRRYFTPGIGDKQRGYKRLHEEVWMHANGVTEVPDGFHVHHIDHDHSNNDPRNLRIVPAAEHTSYHQRKRLECPDAYRSQLDHLERIRPQAAEWHRSDAGREWHREHGRRTWEGREYVEKSCEQCGDSYETRSTHGGERFCSNKCKSAWRRDSGVDDVDRTCAVCGIVFRINKYSRAKNCSRQCGGRFRRLQRENRLQLDG